ncbi:hypothetical protein [Nocardioides sp. AN3]
MTLRQDIGIDLYWLPLGAGERTGVVRSSGRIFEWLTAGVEHRERRDLYHAALEVAVDGERWAIEMGPVWQHRGNPDRGVVCEGPVGLRVLGHSRFFRYEVRCWRGGVIPDAAYAVDSPRRLSSNADQARRLLAVAPGFPRATWGRDEQHTGEMWNSNSLVAWLLARSGHDMTGIDPPRHGRAPGWAAGVRAAERIDRLDARTG